MKTADTTLKTHQMFKNNTQLYEPRRLLRVVISGRAPVVKFNCFDRFHNKALNVFMCSMLSMVHVGTYGLELVLEWIMFVNIFRILHYK